ncbi:MerR family transcriptional regulator [Furfurilactobacillus rossiae]|uniref:HTH merR-type domain-containing protein n=1 Tax=Furfurilactobacillus rossiae DSM 15814 TaxID=1114972 RepID=A0A0R1RBZ0_9LACO|nr:MerR family transcriptional regulator [Furfurilactobacillus rossiae]KRL53950.1 hypothetical protein FD35_GL000781 [Furfurilactobacillus rossiae DSM 15814]MCF6164543.1 MerR family transcriptional regulator [Furfurilactobacillus rossiae]QFR66633.1 MerR family transcriptional regulator [Furfurilactobacillus rossiae]QLE62107.1 Transcriptional regulator MerR [Furfurilactobacillus rossiae]QLE64826.1 Transcriptional regulator MerR family [Furfurilactobacillus rossiae]
MERTPQTEGSPEWLRSIINSDDILIGIGDLSRATDVSTAQLRYWTDKGYIHVVNQDEGNRKYTYDTAFKVRAIKAYMDEGFTLVAATKRMQKHREVIHLLKDVMMNRLEGVGTDEDGSQIVSLGLFDPDPQYELVARLRDGKTRFELQKKA